MPYRPTPLPPRPAPRTRAGRGGLAPQTHTFAPPRLSGLRLWLKSDRGLYTTSGGSTAAAANGDAIGRWEDQSGQGTHLTQATAARRPTLETPSAWNSRPAVKFIAASTQYLTHAAFAETSQVSAGTWAAAFFSDGSGTQGIVCPASNCLGLVDDNGNAYFWEHSGAYVAGHAAHYRTAAGKTWIARFDGAATGDANRLRSRTSRRDRTLAYTNPVDAVTPSVAAGLSVGRDATPAYLNGRILELCYWNRALSDAEARAVENYFRRRYFRSGASAVYCVGDSLTEGYPITLDPGDPWPDQLAALMGSAWSVDNEGIRAYRIEQLENPAHANVDPLRDEWRPADVAIHQGGTNNFYPATGNQSAATTLGHMQDSVTARHAEGFQVLVCTVPPIGPQDDLTPTEEATFESRRLAYNTSVRAGSTGADGLIDWAADSRLADPADDTYFYSGDQIHLTVAGNGVCAALAQKAIADLANPTPPAAPVLTATTLDSSAGLAWTDCPGASLGYYLERSLSGAGSWSVVAHTDGPTVSATDTGLTNLTTYDYRVRARNAAGYSEYSNTETVTPEPAPAAPVLSGSAGNTTASLSWTRPATAQAYSLERSLSGAGSWSEVSHPSDPTHTYGDTGLTNDQAYDYRVRASNDFGYGSYSNTLTLTPEAPPPTTLASDTFTDTNGTGLAAHTMDQGAGWTVHTGTLTIVSNATACGVAPAIATTECGESDVTVSADLDGFVLGSDQMAVVVRFVDTDNYWYANLEPGLAKLHIKEVTAGVTTDRAQAGGNSGVAGATLVVTAFGNTITATYNGGTPLVYGSASAHNTATRHGIRANETFDTHDDFLVTTP